METSVPPVFREEHIGKEAPAGNIPPASLFHRPKRIAERLRTADSSLVLAFGYERLGMTGVLKLEARG